MRRSRATANPGRLWASVVMMNARWFFSSPWRRAWFAIGVLVTMLAGIAAARWLLVERQRAWLMAAEYPPPPEGMVFVPAGWFLMGTDHPDRGEEVPGLQRVFLPAFYIDQHEVTNAEFRAVFPDHRYPEGAEDVPASQVFKPQAEEYARALGRRLPTGAEWEKAARGSDGREWPWGNEFRPECANIGRLSAEERQALEQRGISCDVLGPRLKVAVGSFPCGASPYGALDMAGNVWEWVADVYYDPRAPLDFTTPRVARGILRGGAYGYGPDQARTWYQAFEDPAATCNDVGFRTVMDAVPAR